MAIELGKGSGPLRGVRVVELAGIGPAPHACTLLADLGADVVRIDRPSGAAIELGAHDVLTRGRPSVALDLKRPEAIATVLDLVDGADVLVEGMRPGVAERLGLGPDACLARNPRLVYGRMTGWGQAGPWATTAGHDLGYVALTGVLHGMGQDPARPHFPANLVGDFGGGSTYLVIGLLAALLEARVSGAGQVVDAAIVDGTAHLDLITQGMRAGGLQGQTRLSGLLDGAAPFYDVYETADGRHLAVGALEPQFYAVLLEILGIDDVPDRDDPAHWPVLRERIAAAVAGRTLAEWADAFDGSDACVVPVLTPAEAADHPHLAARGTYVVRDGVTQAAPAPRFSRTQASLGSGPTVPGRHTREALAAWGVDDVEALLACGAAVQAE